ncbi:MAG: MBL fold metallo-hydrolase [Bdellovibrionales bacterium]|nr:MBL fold metallo-hydrolase [Bdellovibrionales bacterium]
MKHESSVKLTFLGAAGTVTGSRSLLQVNKKKYLIDCGLFQGPKEIRIKNWDEFPHAKEIECVFLTHAHIDHSGYLPKLVREGFRGKIYCSQATADLLQIMLLDSAHLQEEDARFANREKYSEHDPALPLYDAKDAESALKLLTPLKSDEWVSIDENVSVKLTRSGHILGSRFVQLHWDDGNGGKTITFSGDLGNGHSNIIKGPVSLTETDYLVMESTYGDRVQPHVDIMGALENIIQRVWKREGTLVIPAFSVGRTQEIIYFIRQLEVENRIPQNIPVWVDSPMALDATEIYMRHREELKSVFREGEVQPPLCPSHYKAVSSADESMLLCMSDEPGIVISAAGMLTGGRILHHLKARLPYEKNAVLFVGYQVEGTKGRLLKQGLTKIRIHHKMIDVEAEVLAIESLSAHADSDNILDWCRHFEKVPKKIFLNHGEPSGLGALSYRLRTELDWQNTIIAEEGVEYDLDQ